MARNSLWRRIVRWGGLLAIVVSLLSFTGPGQRFFEIARNLEVFSSLFRELNTYYVDDLNPNQLIRKGIDEMLGSLDPYTNYIPEDEVETFRTLNTGTYGGIGATTRVFGGRIVITGVMKGFSAERGGLKVGDEVVRIDGVDVARITTEEAGQLTRGQIGTSVKLTVRRPGTAEPVVLDLKREKVKVSNVPFSGMLESQTGYVKLADFTPEAAQEVKNAVTRLKGSGARSMILDLRGNPGGLLNEAVDICNLFLPKDKLVVSTKGKIVEQNRDYLTQHSPVDLEIPVAVLIDRGSASASEIVAGTLQDYDRALVIGEKSYGKGLVQMHRPLSYNSQLKVTTAKYYTPTGRCIQVLDYGHRRSDGSVGAIPDSVKKEFRTSRGRKVFDGGGIDPDISVEHNLDIPLLRALDEQGLIFDYATQYSLQHPTIPPPNDFRLTDAEYGDFIRWMTTREFMYDSELDTELQRFREAATASKQPGLLNTVAELERQVAASRRNELTLHRGRIASMLEAEIALRYYLESGYIEAGFENDREIRRAIATLNSTSEYKKLLNLQ